VLGFDGERDVEKIKNKVMKWFLNNNMLTFNIN
jgi:hypothetical protein